MEFSGLSVIKVRNLVSAVGYAYHGKGFFVRFAYTKIQALVMVENGINPRALSAFGRQTESTESSERPLGLQNRRQFFFLNLIINALTNQNWQELKTAQL